MKNIESTFFDNYFLKVALCGKACDYAIKTSGKRREAEKTKKATLGPNFQHSSSYNIMPISMNEVPEAAHVVKAEAQRFHHVPKLCETTYGRLRKVTLSEGSCQNEVQKG